jgi:membrane protein YdbS with pleckstrin-like domain
MRATSETTAARGWKRLSAVLWTAVALLCAVRAPVWAILHQDQGHTPVYVGLAVLVPLVLHLATVWIINGFTRTD